MEGEEQEPGALVIDALFGDGVRYFLNCHLDCIRVFEEWDVEFGLGALAAKSPEIVGALVVEAVFVGVERGRSAADSVGFYVLALWGGFAGFVALGVH